jgi:hypothetical protein
MNNAMRPLFLAAAAALCAAPALRAQQPLSLQDAIARAQEQGAQARAAVGTRDAARARDRAFGTQFFPLLSVGGTAPSYTRSITPVIQPEALRCIGRSNKPRRA